MIDTVAFDEITHQCENIGPAERAKRNRIGAGGAILTLFLAVLVVAEHLGWPYRLAIGFPALVSAMGFFQARAHTCVAFVASGIKVMGDSRDSAQRVVDPAEKAAFRRAAAGIYARGFVAAAAVVAVLLVLP